jgi:4-hydroxy-tetrahydrodipicolinate reductase
VTPTLNICVAGASGRMGRMILHAARAQTDMRAVAALSHVLSSSIGEVIADVAVTANAQAAIALCDVLIDFSKPEVSLENLAICAALGKPAVVGTTGLSTGQFAQLQAVSAQIPIVFSANMSLGVNVLQRLVELGAKALRDQADIEIIETHHSQKVDAPSGTALMLGHAAALAQGQTLDDIAVLSREGIIGVRKPGTIGFSTVRGGDIIGDHTVLFAVQGERIELTHRAQSRATYAHGALKAAQFVAKAKPGLYSMMDVLGI